MIELGELLRRHHPRHPLASEIAQMTLPQMWLMLHDVDAAGVEERNRQAIQATLQRMGGR